MYSRSSTFTMLLALMCASSALAGPVYLNQNVPYGQKASIVAIPELGEAQAAADSDAAGARAAAAKINSLSKQRLDAYGYQIGEPLLTRRYGVITNIYAASLPPGALVAETGPTFLKGDNGQILYQSPSRIASIAI